MIRNAVTGANGFIGCHLMTKPIGDVFPVQHDLISKFGIGVDRVFFLSTYGNMAYHKDQYAMVKANVIDLLSMLKNKPQFVLYMSSSSVLLPVQTPYSRTKRAAEEILQALPELKSCIVRPYSVTGVGEQKEHLIPTLIRSCMEGEEMPFDPHPVHDFIDVEDVVDGLIHLADNQMTGIYEFGSGIPHHNEEILELVAHFCQKRPNVYRKESLRSYDTDQWFCRSSPPWWRPKKTLAQSIEEMVEAYKREHC